MPQRGRASTRCDGAAAYLRCHGRQSPPYDLPGGRRARRDPDRIDRLQPFGGRPITDPRVQALILTAIAPHTLSARPLVLSPESHIRFFVFRPSADCGVFSRRVYAIAPSERRRSQGVAVAANHSAGERPQRRFSGQARRADAVEPRPSVRGQGVSLLDVEDAVVEFQSPGGSVRALDGVSLAVGAAETVAVVGESGAGRTTLARAVLGLQPLGFRLRAPSRPPNPRREPS